MLTRQQREQTFEKKKKRKKNGNKILQTTSKWSRTFQTKGTEHFKQCTKRNGTCFYHTGHFKPNKMATEHFVSDITMVK